MGPTNIALVKLFQADQQLRQSQERLDSASRSVRLLERRIADLTEKVKLSHQQLRERQTRQSQFELDIKSREARIEKLRTQQQEAKSHKEYQVFLTEINTEKVDKGKSEDELLKAMQLVENSQAELKDLQAQLEGEQKKYGETKAQLGGRLAELQTEVDRLTPVRAEAAKALPPKALDLFERNLEKYDGETMAAIGKPDRRREEYNCQGCHMDLVADVYNRLKTRDEPIQCPNCRRLLYIPEDLSPDVAVHKPKERREKRGKEEAAVMSRQLSAIDVARSIQVEEDEPEVAEGETQEATAPAASESAPQPPSGSTPST